MDPVFETRSEESSRARENRIALLVTMAGASAIVVAVALAGAGFSMDLSDARFVPALPPEFQDSWLAEAHARAGRMPGDRIPPTLRMPAFSAGLPLWLGFMIAGFVGAFVSRRGQVASVIVGAVGAAAVQLLVWMVAIGFDVGGLMVAEVHMPIDAVRYEWTAPLLLFVVASSLVVAAAAGGVGGRVIVSQMRARS